MDRAGGPGRFRILKFGGTSVTGVDRVRVMASVVRERLARSRPVVVVSAFEGVTNALARGARDAVKGAGDDAFTSVAERHRRILQELVGADAGNLADTLEMELGELGRILRGVGLVGECSPRTLDSVLSFGERLSALLVAGALRRAGLVAEPCDARGIVVTDARFGEARVDMAATSEAARAHFDAASALQVVTGFIGATPAGETTTLGRGASDYTAAVLGAVLDAEAVEIWTDVSGVMSADPRVVPDAFSLESLTYDELLELSHWGARVVHAAAVRPLRERGIPILILNTLSPDEPGTRVVRPGEGAQRGPVRGLASVDRVALLQVSGYGLLGGARAVARLFEALARVDAKVLLVSQGSSERSLCVAVMPESLAAARESVEGEFLLERQAGLLDAVVVEEDCSVVAIVGEGMRERPGIAGRLFGVLGDHRINVRAIAQGASELNISAVVGAGDEGAALRAVHDAFFHAGPRPAEVYLAGVGRVGSALLAQLAAGPDAGPGPRRRALLAGIASSRRSALAPDGIDPAGWRTALDGGRGPGLDALVEAALASRRHPRVFVDCTASPEPVEAYEELLRAGVAVVSANKLGFAGPGARFQRLRQAEVSGGRLYFETTVGAGLPVLRTVAELRETGDRIRAVEGVLSGTLGYVLDRVMAGEPFSQAVAEAHRAGYTEPDPREDLGGADVLRKLVILARVAGIELEPEEPERRPLLPEAWEPLSTDEFWERLSQVDEEFRRRADDARASGGRLVYMARWEEEGAAVGLEVVPADHPAAALRSSENLVAVRSDRYSTLPLVVRGPGAGPEVTAAGVYAEILRARAELGGPVSLAGGGAPGVGREAASSPSPGAAAAPTERGS